MMTEQQRQQLHRKTLITVIISQTFGGAGLAAGISVGALIAQDLLGSETLSGLPTAVFTLGAALTAFLVGRATQKSGRRRALGFGFTAGGVGAIGVIAATQFQNPLLLFVSLFVYGAGTATNLQTRYAGTDLAAPDRKATAISMAMVATTLGAVAGPNLIEPLGGLALRLGLPVLTGPFLLAAAAYLIAGAVLLIMLRPDPFLMAKELNAAASSTGNTGSPAGSAAAPTASDLHGQPRLVRVGGLVMITSQIIMVGIMTMTPIHMRAHDHTMGAVGLVIGLHVAAMWLPSLVTGMWVDRVGPRITAIVGGLILLAAGLLAAVAPGDDLTLIVIALILLGVGWNLGLVSGTTLIVHGTHPDTRAGTQGNIDVLYQLFGAGAGILSGILMSAAGFGALAIGGGILALIIVPALGLTPSSQKLKHH